MAVERGQIQKDTSSLGKAEKEKDESRRPHHRGMMGISCCLTVRLEHHREERCGKMYIWDGRTSQNKT